MVVIQDGFGRILMKMICRVLSAFLAMICVFSMLTIAPITADADNGTNDAELSYRKKKVAVIFDTSGSMNDTGTNKGVYARYATQMLVSLLSARDELSMVFMNSMTADKSETYTPDLTSSDRDGEVEKMVQKLQYFIANGTATYGEAAITKALSILYPAGSSADENECERWLIVLTDGVFNSGASADNCMVNVVTQHTDLQTVYIGLSNAALNLNTDQDLSTISDQKLKNNIITLGNYGSSYTGFHITDSEKMVSTMQTITGMISGRYILKNSEYQVLVQKTANGDGTTKVKSDVVIRLNQLEMEGIALKNLSFVLQNCDAQLKNVSYTDGTGATHSVTQLFSAKIVPENDLGMKSGSSAVIARDAQQKNFFSGGEIVFSFESTETAADTENSVTNSKMTIMLEPALTLKTIIEYQSADGSWKEADEYFSFGEMAPGQTIRVKYNVVVQGTNQVVDKNDVGAQISISYTADGNSTAYNEGDPITLKVGNHVVGVLVTLWDGIYSMYTPIPCNVVRQDSHYFVKGETDIPDATPEKPTIRFEVYKDNQPVSKSDLSSYIMRLEWRLPDGTKVDLGAGDYRILDDGKIEISRDLAGKPFGVYSAYIEVTNSEGARRSLTQEVSYYPDNLLLTIRGDATKQFSLHQLTQNEAPFTFELTADGNALDFDNGLFSYRVTAGALDVTSQCVVVGNVLTFTPNSETMGGLAEQIGNYEVKLSINCSEKPELSTSESVSLTLTDTIFEIKPIDITHVEVDRFALKDSAAHMDVAIYRDGVLIPYEELMEDIANGEVQISCGLFSNILLPAGYELISSATLGDGIVRCQVTRDQIGILATFSGMMIFSGEKEIVFSYETATFESAFQAVKSPIFSYIWRWMIILAVIYLIIFAILTPSRRRHVPGFFVHITVGSRSANVEIKAVKRGLIPKRLIPFFGLTKNQDPILIPLDDPLCRLQIDDSASDDAEGPKRKVSSTPGVEYINFCNSEYEILRYDSLNAMADSDGVVTALKRLRIDLALSSVADGESYEERSAALTTPGSLMQVFQFTDMHTGASKEASNSCTYGTTKQLSEEYYACFSKNNGKLRHIFFFVRRSNG